MHALLTPVPSPLPDDLRSVVGYYQSCLRASDRAARQLLEYASMQRRRGAP
jgi:hypothetical protein